MTAAVRIERRGRVALLEWNDPAKRNAMTPAFLDAIGPAVAALSSDRDVRAVVVAGAGGNFCAGADFSTTPELVRRTNREGRGALVAAVRALYDACLQLLDLPQPTVAAVEGAAIGGGLGLALLCDLRVVAEDAKLAFNFSRLGIHPGMGLTAAVPALCGAERGAELLLSGRRFDGTAAAAYGLALEAVPAERVRDRAWEHAEAIAAAAPLATRAIALSLRAARRAALVAVLDNEARLQAALSETEDAREGIVASMQKREPEFNGR